MIRRRDDATVVITQTAHAWLSGQFAMHWGNDDFQFPALSQEMIMAAVAHDNGWTAWEQAPQIDDQHRPIDFLDMPVATHMEIWRRGIYELAAQNSYVAVLVSLHGRYLVENRLRSNSQDTEADKALLEAFSVEQRAWEETTIACLKRQPYFAAGCETHRLEANLRLLQVLDWFSLLLCMNKLSETVVVDVPGRTPNQRLDIRLRPTGSLALTMTPWPFNCPAFELMVQARQLPDATFGSNEAFQTAWQAADVKSLVFRVERNPQKYR